MTEKEKVLALFDPKELSTKFKALAEQYFDHNMVIGKGFELYGDQNEALKYCLPESKLAQYQNDFVIIGQATHSGSSYAFYKVKLDYQMEDWPMIVWGDEGGVLVLAKNLDDFLRFLCLNVEPFISTNYDTNQDEFDLFYMSEENEAGLNLQAYCEWIENTYNLKRILSIEQAKTEIIGPAQALYQPMLDAITRDD